MDAPWPSRSRHRKIHMVGLENSSIGDVTPSLGLLIWCPVCNSLEDWSPGSVDEIWGYSTPNKIAVTCKTNIMNCNLHLPILAVLGFHNTPTVTSQSLFIKLTTHWVKLEPNCSYLSLKSDMGLFCIGRPGTHLWDDDIFNKGLSLYLLFIVCHLYIWSVYIISQLKAVTMNYEAQSNHVPQTHSKYRSHMSTFL